MLNKNFHLICLLFILAACANSNTPSSSKQKYDVNLLVGQWYCETPQNRKTTFSGYTHYHANGTAESQVMVKRYLTDNLAWRFSVSGQTQGRIEGENYFEKHTTAPKVEILPVESQDEELALKAFEHNNPEIAQLKTEMRNTLSQFNDRETVVKVVQLDKQSFIGELDFEVGIIRMTCQRIEL